MLSHNHSLSFLHGSGQPEFHPVQKADVQTANSDEKLRGVDASQASFAELMQALDYLEAKEVEAVRQAYRFADEAHLGQLRSSGAPYITHPIAVAKICTQWRLDAPALKAALLHDVMEDCGVTKSEIMERFGVTVADLVDGLTKLDKLQFSTREEGQAENFRKMLLAMAKDVRVILIKLADRTHNMRTLGDVPASKWRRIARETLDIYVPIAHRLGLHHMYRELQDLGFKFLHPWRYQVLTKAVGNARGRRKDLIQKVAQHVAEAFEMARLSMDISGREKTLYSIYRKMKEKQLSFSRVSDIYGFRLVLPTVTDCYTALGVLHQMYQPVPGRFKDYIAIPKVNGYQSLHTTLVGPAGLQIEFQFRTDEMNAIAEAGVAAHWQYKTQSQDSLALGFKSGSESERKLTNPVGTSKSAEWLQSLLDIQNETRDATEFWDHIKVDLFPDEVYVFTHKSEIMALPRGATVVDFAYAIHTSVGDKMIAAKVNGEQVALRTELHNGDMVEVIVGSVAQPNPAWLGFAVTGRARSKIRNYLKAQDRSQSQSLGEKLLRQALRAEGIEKISDAQSHKALWEKILHFTGSKSEVELMIDIGLGRRVAGIVAKRIVTLLVEQGVRPDPMLLSRERFTAHESVSQSAIILDGSESRSMVQFASCCSPVPQDAITGYMGHGEGLIVHQSDCPAAQRLKSKDKERFIQVEWSDEPKRSFEAKIRVSVESRKGGLAKIASTIARNEADIVQVYMDEGSHFQDSGEMDLKITVRDLPHLQQVLRGLERTSVVLRVQRL
jgi:GTP pyrophosphokinase